MNVLIVEDEIPAAEKLKILLNKYEPSIQIIGRAQSVKDGVKLIQQYGDNIDLVFLDIQLTDGLSFDIFKEVSFNKPVIFITAFDHYALEAFQTNAIDYLLKPVTYDGLVKSMQKIDALRKNLSQETADLQQMMGLLKQKKYKDRFMVKIGDHIYSITIDQVQLFFAEGRDAYLITKDNKKYIIDHKIETLAELLEPQDFFRVNRSIIINIDSIREVIVYSNSRLKITMQGYNEKEVVVSRDRVGDFKDWYDGLR